MAGMEADVYRCRSGGLAGLVVTILLMVMLPAVRGAGQQTPRSAAPAKFAQAADKVFQEGISAYLPPHLSKMLGLSSKEEQCLVIQNFVRNEKVVQGFDISFANKNDIVLFVVNETTRDEAYYLTSPQGRLRKVVLVKSGQGDTAQINDKDHKAFQKERQFWLDRLVPASASQ